MASNTVLDAGSGGDTVVTKERTHDGDASKQQGVFISGVSGTEGAYTFVDVDAGGGVEAAALRVTIASDSTGVLSVDDNGGSLTVDNTGLTELAAAINASSQLDVNIAASNATVAVSNSGLTELAAAINASSQVDVNIAASGATVAVSHAALTELAAAINASGQLDVNVAAGGVAGFAEDGAHTTGDEGVVMLAVRRDTAAVGSDTDGDYSTINVNGSGRLYTSATVDAALPAGDNNIGNVDIASIAAGDNNIGNVDIASALPAGTNNIGDVDVASIAAGTNTIGNVGLVGRTTGGLSIFRSIDLDESEEEVKGSAGQVYWIHAINLTAAVLYLKFYNDTAANVAVGTTTPVLTFPLPTQGDTNGAGFTVSIPQGLAFSAAICAAVTTGLADNDTGAPGANACVVNIGYT